MTDKREKPVVIPMPFAEAWERLAGVDPKEMPDNAKLKKKGPPKRPRGVERTEPGSGDG